MRVDSYVMIESLSELPGGRVDLKTMLPNTSRHSLRPRKCNGVESGLCPRLPCPLYAHHLCYNTWEQTATYITHP